jgi:hypothetical protein
MVIKKMIKRTLYFRNETANKLRWDALERENGAPFEFYIFKRRVPQPWPKCISVSINSFTGNQLDFIQSSSDPEHLNKPTKVMVKYNESHTETFRYAQIGDEKGWQIGMPYVPKSILINEFSSIPEFLEIQVYWDFESGKFEDSPIYRGMTDK